MNPALVDRIKKGAASELFANLVRVLIQVASVPLFLLFWDTTRYGEWLMLTAVLGYLQLSNVGYSQAARTRMAMEVSAGRREAALGIFQSTSLLFLLLGGGVLGLVGLAAWQAATVQALLNLSALPVDELRQVLLLLGAIVALHLQVEVLDAGFRAEGHYGLGTFLVTLGELAIFAATVAALAAGGGLAAAALSHLLGSVLRLVMLCIVLRRLVPWLRFGFAAARWQVISRLALPSFAFMAFPVGQAMLLQGVLLVIGTVLGPAAVVVFNTLRMLTRYAVHLTTMFIRVAGPEMSYAYGRADLRLVQRVHWQVCRLGLWTALTACAVQALAGPWLLRIWTGGNVEALPAVFLPLVLTVLLNTCQTLAANVLLATNHHRRYALVFVLSSIAALALTLALTRTFGLAGAAWAGVLSELWLLLYVLPGAVRFTRSTVPAFLRYVAQPPSPRLLIKLRAAMADGPAGS
jgi:O-antigen/teichoic acid export membrane protein